MRKICTIGFVSLILLSLAVFAEAGAIHVGGGTFTVRDVKSTGIIDGLADADALLGGTGIQSETTAYYPVINFVDPDVGGGGHFPGKSPFPNGSFGNDDNFAVKATAEIYISSAGWVTFGINNDDGARLKIDWTNLIVDDAVHGPTDSFGSMQLSAGLHTVEYVYFEYGGTAECEVFIARQNGIYTEWSGTGAPAQGWELVEAVPEPATILLLGLGGLALLRKR